LDLQWKVRFWLVNIGCIYCYYFFPFFFFFILFCMPPSRARILLLYYCTTQHNVLVVRVALCTVQAKHDGRPCRTRDKQCDTEHNIYNKTIYLHHRATLKRSRTYTIIIIRAHVTFTHARSDRRGGTWCCVSFSVVLSSYIICFIKTLCGRIYRCRTRIWISLDCIIFSF